MRVSKWVVQPGRKNGGTLLVVRLTRRALLRMAIVRVYPSCERVGSFSVRAHSGVNRVRFDGRVRGRPLAQGTYRLLIHVRGQATPAAAVTIVVLHGQASRAMLRRARSANSCSPAEAREIERAVGAWAGGNESSGDSARAEMGKGASVIRVVGAVKGVMKKASIGDEPFSNLILFIVGLLTLSSACLGGFVLVRWSRMMRWRLLR